VNRKIVNIDLDGVVYNYVGAMQEYAEGVLGRTLPEWTEWDVWDQWGIPKGAWKFLFRRGVEDGAIWLNGDPYPGAVEGLWALSDAEWHIRIVTNRLAHTFGHDIAVEHTVKWLKKNAVPYRSIAVIGYGDAKSNYKAVTLVDDSLANTDEWNKNGAWHLGEPAPVSGHGAFNAVVFDRPWNQDEGKRLRAYDWIDVERIVKGMG
jgi:5'(3')-deoxyribonucleotidase